MNFTGNENIVTGETIDLTLFPHVKSFDKYGFAIFEAEFQSDSDRCHFYSDSDSDVSDINNHIPMYASTRSRSRIMSRLIITATSIFRTRTLIY